MKWKKISFSFFICYTCFLRWNFKMKMKVFNHIGIVHFHFFSFQNWNPLIICTFHLFWGSIVGKVASLILRVDSIWLCVVRTCFTKVLPMPYLPIWNWRCQTFHTWAYPGTHTADKQACSTLLLSAEGVLRIVYPDGLAHMNEHIYQFIYDPHGMVVQYKNIEGYQK